jgi:ketosteroid isomerase-like protein
MVSSELECLATLDTYADAYRAKDLDRLMALFDDTDEISVIGTGADELCSGRSDIRTLFERNLTEATATRFDWHWKRVAVVGDAGVIAATLTIHLDLDGRATDVPLRWTVAQARREQGWVWLHRHASSAAGSQDDGTAYPSQ